MVNFTNIGPDSYTGDLEVRFRIKLTGFELAAMKIPRIFFTTTGTTAKTITACTTDRTPDSSHLGLEDVRFYDCNFIPPESFSDVQGSSGRVIQVSLATGSNESNGHLKITVAGSNFGIELGRGTTTSPNLSKTDFQLIRNDGRVLNLGTTIIQPNQSQTTVLQALDNSLGPSTNYSYKLQSRRRQRQGTIKSVILETNETKKY